MSTRSTARDVWVGLFVIVAVAGLIALVGMASDGPGFLALIGRSTSSSATLRASASAARCESPASIPATWSTSTWWRSRARSARGSRFRFRRRSSRSCART